MDEINEKMYDFEANKRNNLIFYGIANETRETQPKLLQKATKLLFWNYHKMRMVNRMVGAFAFFGSKCEKQNKILEFFGVYALLYFI